MPESSKKLLTSTGRVHRCSSECMSCLILCCVWGQSRGTCSVLAGPVHNWDRSHPVAPVAMGSASRGRKAMSTMLGPGHWPIFQAHKRNLANRSNSSLVKRPRRCGWGVGVTEGTVTRSVGPHHQEVA